MEYWPIIGYGIGLHDIKDLLKEEVNDTLFDLAIEITKGQKFIGYVSTGDMYDEERVYILYYAGLPWDYINKNTYINREVIENKITNLIKPHLKKNIDVSQIKEKIDYINDVGCG